MNKTKYHLIALFTYFISQIKSMYSTYKEQSYEEKKGQTIVKKKLEKDLEIEVGTLANLKCITVFSLCWGHTFHLFLLLNENKTLILLQ